MRAIARRFDVLYRRAGLAGLEARCSHAWGAWRPPTGWAGPLYVVALFVVLELFTNFVLETVLYAGAAGVSPVALLASVAFWTWLWGRH